jgi:hypothetical protein
MKALVWTMVALIAWGAGCARLVVIDPDDIAARNDRAWRIRAAPPHPAAPPPAAPPLTPPAADSVTPEAGAPVVPLDSATSVPVVVVAPPPPAPVPFRKRPEVQRALATPTDGLGIPTGLYDVDPVLTAHRRERDAQAQARQTVGGATIVLGAIAGGLGYFSMREAKSRSDAYDSETRDSADNLYFWGGALGVLGLSSIIAGAIMALTFSDRAPLQDYYRETYLDGR